MNTPKLIQRLILIALLITIPVHPNSFFGHCADAFQFTKQSVADVIDGKSSIKTKVSVGLAALIITYVLLRCIFRKQHKVCKKPEIIEKKPIVGQDQAYKDEVRRHILKEKEIKQNRLKKYADDLKKIIEESGTPLDETLISVIEEIDGEDVFYDIDISITHILQHLDFKGSNLVSIVWSKPEMLDRLIQYEMRANRLKKWQLTDGLWGIAAKNLTMDKRDGVAILIKHGANINKKIPGRPKSYAWPRYHEKTRTPLTDTILLGSPAIVKIFLENGAAIEIEPGVSAYDYVKDVGIFGGFHKSKEHIYTILDNHRRKLAKEYIEKTRTLVHAHLTKDPTGIVVGYLEPVYPLMYERPLASLQFADEGVSFI